MKLFIATPMARGDCKGVYAASLAKLFYTLGEHKILFQYQYLTDDGLITRARNRLAVEFLNTDCTHMLMIDSDVGFYDGDVLCMLEAEKNFVSAAYPLRRINWEKTRLAAEHCTADELREIACSDFVLNYGKDFSPNKIISVPEVGGGFNLVTRKVFEDIICSQGKTIEYKPKADEPSYKGHVYGFFDCGRSIGGYAEPEDYMFCKRWTITGGEIWLCPWIVLTHVGEMQFIGSMKYAFLEGSKYNKEKVLV